MPSGSREIEPESIEIDGFHSFHVEDQSISSLSLSYSYHPQYRVRDRLDFSALEGRRGSLPSGGSRLSIVIWSFLSFDKRIFLIFFCVRAPLEGWGHI